MADKINKLKLIDLIKDKAKYTVKRDKTEEIYIDRLKASIVIAKPSRELCLECLEMAQDENRKDKADVFMVYNCVVEPNLKDAELTKAYGCVEPDEIVSKLFEIGEQATISGMALELAGYNNEIKVVKDLKN